MSDQGLTSSITSVTEEEGSSIGWESDTTESSMSAITSNTTDYNTDDKLTPGLGNISISKVNDCPVLNPKKRHKPCSGVDLSKEAGEMRPPAVPTFPYGSNPLPLHRNKNDNHSSHGKRHKYFEKHAGSVSGGTSNDTLSESFRSRIEDRTLTNDNANFDRTSNDVRESHRPSLNSSDISYSQSSGGHNRNTGISNYQRPFYPDMAESSWYQARCFNSYWKNYHFMMDWYQQHVRTTQRLAGYGMSGVNGISKGQMKRQGSSKSARHGNSRSARKKRASKRARSRRLTKERQRASSLHRASTETIDSDTSGGEMEMEITDEMVEFFTKSFKHRIERDNQKKSEEKDEEENHVNIEQVIAGHGAPSISAPLEQPGVRRTSELRLLYGSNAPMIHGMETALQLNFDRVTDRLQPKLWPNMPLKMIFR